MIGDWLDHNRRLALLTEPGLAERMDPELRRWLLAFVDDFVRFHGLDEARVVDLTFAFLRRHLANVRRFEETGAYPASLDGRIEPVDRTEYELALVLSTLTTGHRYRILELVREEAGEGELAVVVGCGPGLELALLEGRYERTVGYDLDLSPFARHRHPSVELREAEFTGQERGADAVFLIELLEHVHAPFDLLDRAVASLRPGGRAVLTTASNEPQFDHVVSFEPGEVERFAAERELHVARHEHVRHRTRRTERRPFNDLFVLRRRA